METFFIGFTGGVLGSLTLVLFAYLSYKL